jgi:hypothetical protein
MPSGCSKVVCPDKRRTAAFKSGALESNRFKLKENTISRLRVIAIRTARRTGSGGRLNANWRGGLKMTFQTAGFVKTLTSNLDFQSALRALAPNTAIGIFRPRRHHDYASLAEATSLQDLAHTAMMDFPI